MKLSKRSSWHNMGIDEDSWPGSDEPVKQKTEEELKKELEEKKEYEQFQKERQEDLDSKKHLSLAHKAQAEGFFDYSFLPEATPICSNGWVQLYAKSFPDDSVLVFFIGDMGIDDIKPFKTLERAKSFFDNLGEEFYPL